MKPLTSKSSDPVVSASASDSMPGSSYFLGVDIGGTKVSAGLVDQLGHILFTTRSSMITGGDAQDGFSAVKRVIDEMLQRRGDITISGIGVSSPGPVDPQTGIVANPCNLPCWRDFPLRSEIERTYGLPAKVDNDANAAGLAEALWGAAAEFDSVFYATIGTGIGTAIVLNRAIFHGPSGAAGEGGHMSIDYRSPDLSCNCGKPGCVEAIASGPGIARRARVLVNSGSSRGKKLLELAGGDVAAITSETVGAAWREGDPMATEILRETADVLAVWFGNLIDLLEPEVVVVGGGLSELISHFFDEISERLPMWCINQRCQEIPMRLARYGPDSGIAGGAALCLQRETQVVTKPDKLRVPELRAGA
jgi:glucokinase